MKKAIAASLAAVVSITSLAAPAAAESIDDLQQKQAQSESKIDGLEEKLAEVQKNMDEKKKELEAIQVELDKTDSQIKEVEDRIDTIKQEITILLGEMEKTKKELEKKKVILAKNVRLMYVQGNASMVEYLFSTDDPSKILYRFQSLNYVAKANKQLFDEVREQVNKLKTQKKALDARKESQEKQKSALQTLRNTQDGQKQDQLKVIGELAKLEETLHDDINQEKAVMDGIESQIAVESQRLAEERQRYSEQNPGADAPPNPTVGSGILGNPMAKGTYVISSGFGYRIHPIYGTKKLHNGIDLAAPVGTPIYAADSGYVLYAGPASGYGNWIVIDHGGIMTVYGHMYSNQLYVRPGQTVTKGQKIAAVGSAGGSTGSHLHFCVSLGNSLGQYQNPRNYVNF